MSEVVELKPNLGRRDKDVPLRIKLPAEVSLTLETPAETLLAVLQDVDGDLNAYAKQWVTRSKASEKSVIVRTMVILNREGNEEWRDTFMELIEAHKQAQAMIAEANVMQFVSDYQLRTKGKSKNGRMEKVPVATYTSVYRLAMASQVEKEKTRGRKEGTEKAPKADKKAEGALADALTNLAQARKSTEDDEELRDESDREEDS